MMWLMAAGAAAQIVLFQLLIWSVQAGQRSQAVGLALASVAVAAALVYGYRRNVSTR
ncbi:MAG TPA: hypothetical protein VNT75_14450 [Symbiobacteriaceae bacterium]|nr:hypothetical protein [Symbiobacteriaceae bacterium]